MRTPSHSTPQLDLSERIVPFPCTGRALPAPKPEPLHAHDVALLIRVAEDSRCTLSLVLLLMALAEAGDRGEDLTAEAVAKVLCRPAQSVLSQVSTDRYLFHLAGRSVPSTVIRLSEDGTELLSLLKERLERAAIDLDPSTPV